MIKIDKTVACWGGNDKYQATSQSNGYSFEAKAPKSAKNSKKTTKTYSYMIPVITG